MKHRVLVTRATSQAGSLVDGLRYAGFMPVEVPTISISIERPQVPAADWLVVTSANALAALHGRPLGAMQLAVVGPATARAARSAGYHVGLVGSSGTGAGLVADFALGPGTITVVQGNMALPTVARGLQTKGWVVTCVVGYRNIARCDLPRPEGEVITFTSPSAAKSYVSAFGLAAVPLLVVSIGPTTSAACEELGIRVSAEAAPHSVDGVISAVRRLLP